MIEDIRNNITENDDEFRGGEFGELIKYTGAGFIGGLLLGAVLDSFGFQTSAWGQWIVRTFSGEGESIFEGIFAINKRIAGTAGSIAAFETIMANLCWVPPLVGWFMERKCKMFRKK